MSAYIATVAEIKTSLGITDTTDDTLLTEWIEGVQGKFDIECGRRFLYAASETEYFDGGVHALYVRRYPIASITSIHVDSDQGWASDSLLASTDYRVVAVRGRIHYAYGSTQWPEGIQNIRVIYAGGFVKSDGSAATYVDAAELDALRRALYLQVGFEWRNRQNLGLNSLNAEGVSVNVAPAELLPEVKAILHRFKRLV